MMHFFRGHLYLLLLDARGIISPGSFKTKFIVWIFVDHGMQLCIWDSFRVQLTRYRIGFLLLFVASWPPCRPLAVWTDLFTFALRVWLTGSVIRFSFLVRSWALWDDQTQTPCVPTWLASDLRENSSRPRLTPISLRFCLVTHYELVSSF